MKKAAVILKSKVDALGWIWGKDYALLLNIHDEFQGQARPEIAEQFGRLMVESIREAGEHFKYRCRLDGEFKVGRSWAETH